jgi:hypothetical protein
MCWFRCLFAAGTVDRLDRVRSVTIVVLAFLNLPGLSLAATSSDAVLTRALVVHHADVPDSWGADISDGPCPLPSHPGVRLTARATSKWGGITLGIWSVAAVTPSRETARRLYGQVVSQLPACVMRYVSKGSTSPAAIVPVVSAARPYVPPLGEASTDWTIAPTQPADGDIRPVTAIVVRTGRAVAWYIGVPDVAAIRHALARARAQR